jgi:signal transduction histidine kinase
MADEGGPAQNPIFLELVVFGLAAGSAVSHLAQLFEVPPGTPSRFVLPFSAAVFSMQALAYGVMALGATNAYCWHGGGEGAAVRVVSPLRYWYWACSNPLVLASCAHVVGVPAWRTAVAALVTGVALILGLGAELVPLASPAWIVLIFFSFALNTIVMYTAYRIFLLAVRHAAAHKDAAGIVVRILVALVAIVWNAFPLVYLLAQFGGITPTEELLILPVLDGIAKILLCNAVVAIAGLYTRSDNRTKLQLREAAIVAQMHKADASAKPALLRAFVAELLLPVRTILRTAKKLRNELDDGRSAFVSSAGDQDGSASRPVSASGQRAGGIHAGVGVGVGGVGGGATPHDIEGMTGTDTDGPQAGMKRHDSYAVGTSTFSDIELVSSQATALVRIMDDFVALHAVPRPTAGLGMGFGDGSVTGMRQRGVDISRLDFTSLSISSLLDATVHALQRSALHKGVTVVLNVGRAMPAAVWADEPRLRFVIMAFLAKSLQCSPHGGRVELRVGSAGMRAVPVLPDGPIADPSGGRGVGLDGPGAESGASGHGGSNGSYVDPHTIPVPFLRVSFTDDGIGLTGEELKKLFDPPSLVGAHPLRGFRGSTGGEGGRASHASTASAAGMMGSGRASAKVVPIPSSGSVAAAHIEHPTVTQSTYGPSWTEAPLDAVDEFDDEDDEDEAGAGGTLGVSSLYFVRSIVEAMGGLVGAHALHGAGTMLYFEFPAFSTDPSQGPARMSTAKQPGKAQTQTQTQAAKAPAVAAGRTSSGMVAASSASYADPAAMSGASPARAHNNAGAAGKSAGTSAGGGGGAVAINVAATAAPARGRKLEDNSSEDPRGRVASVPASPLGPELPPLPPVEPEIILSAYTDLMTRPDRANKSRSQSPSIVGAATAATGSGSTPSVSLSDRERVLGTVLLKLHNTNVR